MRALFLFVCVARGACLFAPVVGSPIGSPKGSTAPLWFIGATAPLWLPGSRGAWRCWANSAGK